jgi:hypothetical protein
LPLQFCWALQWKGKRFCGVLTFIYSEITFNWPFEMGTMVD